MTLLAGAAEADITPPFAVDLLGYVRRPLAARSAYAPLKATACVFRKDETGTTVVVIAADVVGLTTPMAERIRARVGELVGCKGLWPNSADPALVPQGRQRVIGAPAGRYRLPGGRVGPENGSQDSVGRRARKTPEGGSGGRSDRAANQTEARQAR